MNIKIIEIFYFFWTKSSKSSMYFIAYLNSDPKLSSKILDLYTDFVKFTVEN